MSHSTPSQTGTVVMSVDGLVERVSSAPMTLKLRDPGTQANLVGLVANAVLMVLKFIIGALAASKALTADGFNSAGDIIATAIAFIGYQYARKPPDADHHYGHGNAESVAGLIIGGILFATGVFIFLDGTIAFVEGRENPPEMLAIYVAIFTILVKETLYQYVIRVGRKLNSPSLLASARDHRADVFVAFTVLAGIIAARTGNPRLDPLAAVLVGLYIAWLAIEPIRMNVAVLMDKAPLHLSEAIHRVAISDPDVREVDQIRVHPLGSYYMVDLEIYLDGDLELHAAHDVAHRVADLVREGVEHVRGVQVHVNPTGPRPEHTGPS